MGAPCYLCGGWGGGEIAVVIVVAVVTPVVGGGGFASRCGGKRQEGDACCLLFQQRLCRLSSDSRRVLSSPQVDFLHYFAPFYFIFEKTTRILNGAAAKEKTGRQEKPVRPERLAA